MLQYDCLILESYKYKTTFFYYYFASYPLLIIVKNEKLKNTTLKEQFPKSNIKIVERGKIETPNKQIHDHCLNKK
jgi:hypothetical protein